LIKISLLLALLVMIINNCHLILKLRKILSNTSARY